MRNPVLWRARGLLVALLAALTAAAVSALPITAHAATPPVNGQADYIIATDQMSERLLLLDPSKAWSYDDHSKRAVKWSWAPTVENGFEGLTNRWANPSDARLRVHPDHGRVVLTADSAGLLAMISYPQGQRLWATNGNSPRFSNPHAIELLPDGNIAAAASTGRWIRIYTASQGTDKYVQFDLKGGHGVLWDPSREKLWALGDDDLVLLSIGGTPAEPTITEEARYALPTHGGHDLWPVMSSPGRLWISTNSRVYQFDTASGAFLSDYPGSEEVHSVSGVKAVGDHPTTGQIAYIHPKPGGHETWTTDEVKFAAPTTSRIFAEAGFYKARWFTHQYR
ncbi:DUF6528 family protein [Kribbia dieselivorans]|uniref:DUF6528 family protein n=1 Tax=Kribbia dieselivorans TaxID=331526 RepID=UPI000838E58B|nr:DUF6528 family protein [Kribbia dieselivorans]